MKWFTSDWHLSHQGMIDKGGRKFANIDEMNNLILNNVFNNINRGDDLYFLGDLTWSKEQKFNQDILIQLKRAEIRFHWILGNHDKKYKYLYKNAFAVDKMKEITINKQSVTLCHYPMVTWDKSHYNSWLLYGHHHIISHGHETISNLDGKRLNVNCEFFNYTPINENQVIDIMNTKSDNWDLIKKDKE